MIAQVLVEGSQMSMQVKYGKSQSRLPFLLQDTDFERCETK